MDIEKLLPPAVTLDDENSTLNIIDQTLLPGQLRICGLRTIEEIREAIGSLRVRGAPAIGIAAAYGLYLSMKNSPATHKSAFLAQTQTNLEYLAAARPTAVNLRWAVERLRRAAACYPHEAVEELQQALLKEARAIEAEDAAACRAIGEHGLPLLRDGDGLLTHCNAGHLATARRGTALSPIYCALEQGMQLKIYCDETRPLLQGARLTAFELMYAGADVTLLCDNMAAALMEQGRINSVWVGADRIAANGDAANKTGTLGLAILARHFALPFYICAPSSTVDAATPAGNRIEIEQRAPQEVTELWYAERMAPPGVGVYNPAFDVTPASLISAIITEKGIHRPPYKF
ncbi:MAG: S-methyl-5-thioribose-1-phosphate isomerase [Clostridiales bacterium]|nr:S-methyl-5-thioribose-1-phosphate isomerase [Clostridiales bacterium]